MRPLDDEKAPGRVVVWSNPRKLRCDLCDGVANGATKEYHRKYHLGRSRAAQKLVNLHRDEFSLLFAEALKTIEAEERRVDDLVAGGMDRKAAEKLVERERKAAENAEETALAS